MLLCFFPSFEGNENVLMFPTPWVYYTSAQEFIYIAPWTSHKNVDHSYSDTLLTHEFFNKGKMAENPKRELFWTKPYCDEYGEGQSVRFQQERDDSVVFARLEVHTVPALRCGLPPERKASYTHALRQPQAMLLSCPVASRARSPGGLGCGPGCG